MAISPANYTILSGLASQLGLKPVWSLASGDAASDVNGWLGYALSDSVQSSQLIALRAQVKATLGMNVTPDAKRLFEYYRALLDGTTLASYLGQVATRASSPNNTFGTATTFMNRTGHIAREAITSLQAAWANWASINPSGYTAPAGTLTVTASVEYPLGVFTRLKWASANSVVVASGANTLSDAATIPGGIPAGATFWIRSFLAPSANICYGNGTNKSAAIGDLCQNTGSSDMTLGGTITDNSGAVIFPVAIVGQTTKRSLFLLGHSLVDGLLDQNADATGDNGELQRPLDPTYATIRSACVGETVANFLTKATQRVALANSYCSDVIIDFAANDLNGGRTSAQIVTDYIALAALFPGKRIFVATASPVAVTTSDSYATLANQTLGASDAQRQILNTAIRAGISGYTNYIELADFVEQARTGKWKVDGTANKYTSDGTHQTTFANQQITITLP